MDAAARGAVATPLLLCLLFAIYFAIGRALVAGHKPTYVRAALIASVAAFFIVLVVATISIVYDGVSATTLSTFMPWLIGAVFLAAFLLPGSLLQAWLLRPRHNTSLERTRER
ncbi:MAG TPA: hypothetical protein VMF52_20620 [Steroidobacteraceae bacterium]|nr:hypothetical protein [Steroidobacteraceae bacterium]